MAVIGNLLILALDIYMWVIIAGVVISWLIAFEVINVRNAQAANLVNLLNKATDPVYKPVRKFVPPIAGIDLTPIIIIVGIMVLQTIVRSIFY
jgi:YggT family protein